MTVGKWTIRKGESQVIFGYAVDVIAENRLFKIDVIEGEVLVRGQFSTKGKDGSPRVEYITEFVVTESNSSIVSGFTIIIDGRTPVSSGSFELISQ